MSSQLHSNNTDGTLDYYREFKSKLICFLAEELEISPDTAISKSQKLFQTGVLASAACAGFDIGLSHENTMALMISIEGLNKRQEARKNLENWFFSNQERENRQCMERLVLATIHMMDKVPHEHKVDFQNRFSHIRSTFS